MNGFAALDIHPHRRYVVDMGGRRSSRCRLHINFAPFLHSLDFTQNLGVTLSVIETAKHNGLDPFGYLLFLLQELPKLGENPTEEQLVPLLPWAESLPEYCKLK